MSISLWPSAMIGQAQACCPMARCCHDDPEIGDVGRRRMVQLGVPWHESDRLAARTLRDMMGVPTRAVEIRPVGDVIGTIQRLKDADLSLAVATGDDRHPTEVTLSLLGIADDMAVIVCGDDPLPEKPDPAALFHIGRQIGISIRQMLMVGDTVNDMLTGLNAAVAGCIGINGSTGDPERLAAHADVVSSSIEQISVIDLTH